MTAGYGPQLPTRADVAEAYADWGDAMHTEDLAREAAEATGQGRAVAEARATGRAAAYTGITRDAGHGEAATAAEAWAALRREGPGADAVRSYLAPGPEPRYDTPGVRAAAMAEREAGE